MKKIIALILVSAMILSAASCGGNTPAESTAPAPAPAASATSDNTGDISADTQAPAPEAEQTTSAKTEEKVIPDDTEYVIADGITDRMKALSELVPGNTVRLKKVFQKAKNGEPITVAYLGGSITQGSSAGNDKCYAKLTTEWFEKTFPDSKITYVNAGIGATGSYIGVFRTERDVLKYSPDIVFIDFSVNDTTEFTHRNIESYEGVIRKLWLSESAPAVVTVAMTQNDGTSFQQYHRSVCEAYDIPMISYHDAIMDVIKNGHIVWKDISDDTIHPNVTGHAVLTEIITSYLQKVLDDADNTDGAESDFSEIYVTDKYASAELILPGSEQSSDGWEIKTDNFGNFGDYWQAISRDGTFEGVSPLKFETEAKSIGIFYGKLTKSGGIFDVVIDGETVKTINTDFSGGWGNYVEAEEIAEFEECAPHTIEIIPQTGKKSIINISAIAITK